MSKKFIDKRLIRNKKYHYLYKIINLLDNKYYYGMHSTNDLDDGYLGSGIHLRYAIRKHGRKNFKKEIIKFFDSREELSNAEKSLITEDMLKDDNCYNVQYGGEYWNTTDTIPVRDQNGNCFKVHKEDPRYLSGELVHSSKGQTTVKDKDGNIFNVSIDDPRYLSSELVGHNAGDIVVKDKAGNKFMTSKDDPKYLSGELVGVSKGYITVKDKDGNTFYVSKDDPRYLSSELTSIWKDRKHSEETKQKIGKANSIHQKGKNNSQYGTCWITKDGINKK